MAEIRREDVDLQESHAPGAPMDWQRLLLGWGFLLLIASLFMGAATNTGVASKLIGVAGLLVIAISTVALIAKWIRSRA